MPRVPIYDGPQVKEEALPTRGAFQQEIDVTKGQRALAGALGKVGDVVDERRQRSDQDTAFATDAKLKTEWLEYEGKLRAARRGRDAETYDTEVEAWWKDAATRYGKDLSPGAQRLVGRSLATSQLQALAGAKTYKEQQLNASAAASYTSAQTVSVNEAATVGNETAVVKALADMDQKRLDRAALEGWTPEQTAADKLAWSTTLHGVMVQKLARADPAAAQVYYDKYKGDISAQQQNALEAHLSQTSAVVDGSAAADGIWKAMGPKADGQPVELDKMEAAAREQFKNDPTRQHAAIADIQQRAAAFNSAERERTAGKTNTVMDAYAKGASLTQLQRMPEYQSLPGQQRAQIQEHIRDRNHMLWAQGIEDRARLENLQLKKAYPSFFQYSDPSVLTTMTRDQVRALQPALGNQLTEHLLNKWEAIQKPAAKLEARMDTEDFNHVADQLGLKPFQANTEDRKRQLGELKYRVEQMVDMAQQAKKSPLTRAEKMELMTSEMARTVTVNPTFGFEKQVPVIQLGEKDLKNVVVPEGDRAQIAAALKTMYEQTKSPLYAPTEQNMRRLYLTHKSRAATLLPAEK